MKANLKKIGVVVAVAAALGVASATPASAVPGGSFAYSGSCGNGCFTYTNAAGRNIYTDRWLGLVTTNPM